ncbi:MAG: GGDEF domain-containing phosphodiesterase [Lachnospiraceae bacterium]|nr:GGDEF domain-containing phosphodiesterase [Lachnospiraceae bacterium]
MKSRYLILMVVTVLMLAGVAVGYSFLSSNERLMRVEEAGREFEILDQTLASKMQVYTQSVIKNLEGAAGALSTVGGGTDKQVLKATLTQIKEKGGYEDIAYVGTSNNATGYDGSTYDISFDPYYTRALIGDSTITRAGFRDENDDAYMATVPVIGESGIIGALRAKLSDNVVEGNLTISNYRGREIILLLDRAGAVISATTGTDMSKVKTVLDIFEKNSDSRAQFEAVIRQGRGLFIRVDENLTVDTFGEGPYYIAYQGVSGTGEWGVMMVMNEDKLFEFYGNDEVDSNATVSIILFAFALAGAIGLGVYGFLETLSRNRMYNLAYYDEFAGTMNINYFRKGVNQTLTKSNSGQYAFVLMGIAKYEYLRDFFGEDEISRILKDISSILKSNVKRDEYFCHNFGEEYDLLLSYHNKDELVARLKFLEGSLEAVNKSEGSSDKYALTFRYGVAFGGKDAHDFDTLMSRANMAHMEAKGKGAGAVEFYTEKMQSRIVDEKEIERDMYDALENREFLVYLQPKFNLSTGLQAGAEALIRWMHPVKGLMYPGRFIETFEKNGFVTRLDMYMLEELCRRIKVWTGKGYRPMPLSLNISQQNLLNPEFVNDAIAITEKYGVSPNLIIFEMSEKVVVDNMSILNKIMEQMKDHGFVVSMDNFGTGSTSMNTLYNVPVDELKIDRKFLLNAEKTDRGQNVIQSVIEMAKRLKIDVVSEGVENKQQAILLREMGCDMIQGFAFSEPLPEHEYEEYAYGPRARDNSVW